MGIISGFVQLLGQISAFFLGCTHSGVQTPQRPTLKAALEHTSLPGEEQVWRWCGGPGCGSSGSNRHTGEHTWAQESSTQRGPFLVPREAGASMRGQSLQWRLHPHSTMVLCFYGSWGFLLKCSGLHMSSLPSPQAISFQLTSVFSLGLLSKPYVPAPVPMCVSRYMSQVRGFRAVARTMCLGLTLFCLPQTSYCTLLQ